MAHVSDYAITDGFRGKFGKMFVFRSLRDKTVVSRAATKKVISHSEKQRATRIRFRDASAYAKKALQNPEKKTFYEERARRLNLPNAYTAAVTDYLRPAKVSLTSKKERNKKTVVTVSGAKVGFRMQQCDMRVFDTNGKLVKEQTVVWKTGMGSGFECSISMEGTETLSIIYHDVAGNEYELVV